MDTTGDSDQDTSKRIFKIKHIRIVTVTVLGLTLAYTHYHYVSHLFENDRNFSHLSELEREMSLRTEMGFYYSYYKTIVEERPFFMGLSKLMYDKLVEYPKEVNAFNRFNIHPEVIIGAVYKYVEPWLNSTHYRECHTVDRGQGLSPVRSCVGIGEPVMFYLEAVWWLAGLTIFAIFMSAVALSNSILGGLLAVTQYFANHAECTRVQWSPNERENFAVPLLLVQTGLISMQLRRRNGKLPPPAAPLQITVFVVNCLCLLFWQFTQFVFLVQTVIFFIMEQLYIIDLKTLCIFLHSHFCGIHMAVLLLQGNDFLETSLYTSLFFVVAAYSMLFSSFRIQIKNKTSLLIETWLIVLRISIVITASIYLKKVIGDFMEVEEDSHIWDILYSKLTNYKTFHTMIYTCSEVFDFLPMSSVYSMIKTGLIPSVVLAGLNFANCCLYKATTKKEESKSSELVKDKKEETKKAELDVSIDNQDEDDSGIENNADNKIVCKEKDCKDIDELDKKLKPDVKEVSNEMRCAVVCFFKNLNVEPNLFYNLSQMVVYGMMAALVMRLKVLFVPQMCIVSSLIMNINNYVLPKSIMRYLPFVWVIAALPFAYEMHQNIQQEMSHIGEFTDIQQEEMLEWISRETPDGTSAVFAGSMPVLAAVMLTTRRPIVAHPHYEHKEARDRAYVVYKTYGRFSPIELYHELTKLKATYLIVENKYCYGRSSKGCQFTDIWDVEAPHLRKNPRVCHTLLTEPVDHFYPVFKNNHYSIFRIHDLSIRYMPRSFDT